MYFTVFEIHISDRDYCLLMLCFVELRQGSAQNYIKQHVSKSYKGSTWMHCNEGPRTIGEQCIRNTNQAVRSSLAVWLCLVVFASIPQGSCKHHEIDR